MKKQTEKELTLLTTEKHGNVVASKYAYAGIVYLLESHFEESVTAVNPADALIEVAYDRIIRKKHESGI